VRKEPSSRARYEEIAVDLAQRVVRGELVEGDRVLGRSSLAGTYQVSPETVRRAVAILHERGVLQAVAGSGIRINSRSAAVAYVESLQARATLEEGTQKLRRLLRQRREIDARIEEALERLLSQTSGALSPRHVEEIPLPTDSWAIGRSLGEIRLRSRTGATAVALCRGEVDHFSPPADMLLQAGDVLMVLGDEPARATARALLLASAAPSERPE
jgi:K+/H+ antiporter YhaU regulatory subunit KhtT